MQIPPWGLEDTNTARGRGPALQMWLLVNVRLTELLGGRGRVMVPASAQCSQASVLLGLPTSCFQLEIHSSQETQDVPSAHAEALSLESAVKRGGYREGAGYWPLPTPGCGLVSIIYLSPWGAQGI